MNEIENSLNLAIDELTKAKSCLMDMQTRVNMLEYLLSECAESLCANCRTMACHDCKWKDIQEAVKQ